MIVQIENPKTWLVLLYVQLAKYSSEAKGPVLYTVNL